MENNTEIPEEIVLREDESVEKILGRSYLSFIMTRIVPGAVFLVIILLGVSFGILYYAADLVTILAPGQSIAIVIFFICLILGIGVTLLVLAIVLGRPYCKAHVYMLTNKRLIFFKKFAIITRRDIDYERITDFVIMQGPIGRWKNYGDIRPVTAGVEFMLGLGGVINSFNGVIDPYNLKKEIMKIYQKYRKDE